MPRSLCRTNKSLFNVLLFAVCFLSANTVLAQASGQTYLKLPLKRLEFADGSSQCGYFDEATKKLIGCKGEVLLEKAVYVRMYSGDYCCSVEGNEGRLGEGIEFIVGTTKLTAKAQNRLDYVVGKLHEYPTYKIKIEVHTDNSGSVVNNQMLSQKRADVIRDYLVNKGIMPERLQTMGYGETRPIADNSTQAGRARNRRVEIEIAN
jgi:hypothetical protein